jgi:hypothetical protein
VARHRTLLRRRIAHFEHLRKPLDLGDERGFLIGVEQRIAPVVRHAGAEHHQPDLARDVLRREVPFGGRQHPKQQVDARATRLPVAVERIEQRLRSCDLGGSRDRHTGSRSARIGV